ncbi:hypothetical protein F3J44_23200 [Pantoea sp. Tr-811]|nr:hypothetical protein [Pantoea sp. Tr-811]
MPVFTDRVFTRARYLPDSTANPVGAGLTREAGDAGHGTGCAGVRGASPLLQGMAARLRARFPARGQTRSAH